MTPIVPPPFICQQRAWDCAAMLKQDRWDELSIEHRINVEVIFCTHPDGLGWREIARMFVLYGAMFDVRV